MAAIDLSGPWRLRDALGEYDTHIDLPDDAISGLAKAGLIPEPYWGRNEYDLRWIAERDWVMSREITLEQTNVDLVLEAVDTEAVVRVNGIVVLETHNAFRSYRADISAAATVGPNTLEISFPSSVRLAREMQEAQPFRVPYSLDNCPIPNGNMLRKPQCDFGWDWNIALAPFGVYGAMTLAPCTPTRVEHILVHQSHSEAGVAVTVTVRVEGDGPDKVDIAFDGATHSIDVSAPGVARAEFNVAAPRLWWPAGLGEQPLYDLTVAHGGGTHRRRIGLRALSHRTDQDEIGRSCAFEVNGHPVFARGANWIPADALAGRITPEQTRDLLQSAVDANMNMIRVWGGGRYEPDWFYDICDELGLMVWQDFMFACNLYPSDEAFLTEVEGEVREVVGRLQHRACLALWCGDNELVGALDWYEESRANRDRYLAAYDRLNHSVERALKSVDADAVWWPSSPSRGRLDFGDAWHDDAAGDMHFWSVWHEGRDFDHYRDVSPRFCSEFGFQSYPSMEVIRRFADPADFNIASPVLESHQKNAGGNARIAETMFRYFRFPAGFEDFVYLSQVQQALAIKTAVTHWRGLKPRCMGALYWQLNDTWPVCSWSSLDHGGGWKLLHHAARDFFAPMTVVAVPDGDTIHLRAINDTLAGMEVSVTARALAMDGTTRALDRASATVTTDAAADVLSLAATSLLEQEMLLFDWEWEDGTRGRDHFAPRPYKAYDLQPSGLQLDHDGATLALTAMSPAFFASIEADVPGRFSDNGLLVLPDTPVTVTFTSAESGATPRFKLRDLRTATYAQEPERVSYA